MLQGYFLFLILPTVVLGRCCSPEKMSGNMDTGIHWNQYIKHVFDIGKFQIDFAAQKVMVYEMDKLPVVSNIIVDFGQGKKYVRYDDGSCQASVFKYLQGFDKCVPAIAYDENKRLGITDSSEEWWFFGLYYSYTSVSEYKLEKSSCKPTKIALRWDTNDWPYSWEFSNVTIGVPSDSDLYQDTSDCVTA